jgi:ligand-binding sensor domain-containing protein
MVRTCTILLLLGALHPLAALDPRKDLTQYSASVWTQQQGLPQDAIRAITQTADGYLWLGTDEGLARFDGYEFLSFNRAELNFSTGGRQRRRSVDWLAERTDKL